MASLETTNPHSSSFVPKVYEAPKGASPKEQSLAKWKSAAGCPIYEDAKPRMTFEFNNHDFVLADVRLMRVQDSDDGVRLELFYDGEIADVGTDLQGFVDAIQASVSKGLQERKMQRFRHMLERKEAGHKEEWEKYMKETNEKGDVEIKMDIDLNGATSAEDTCSPFREAGCVLSFVAVSVTLSPDTADLLGEICFPEYFLDKDCSERKAFMDKQNEATLPWWVYLFFIPIVICFIAVVFAWSRVAQVLYSKYFNGDVSGDMGTSPAFNFSTEVEL